jgi:phenylacetate-CoA ligase
VPGPLSRAGWSAYCLWHAQGDERLPFRPLDEILAMQRRRVRAIVRHAYASVPHYREAMDRAGLRPRDLRSAEDLARLPLVSGEELAAEPERFASRRYPAPRTLELRSSGTTGRPKRVRHAHAALFLALATGRRQRAVLERFVGRRAGYREMTAHRPDAISFQLRRFYEELAWVPRRLEIERAALALDEDFAATVARVNEFRPDVLYGYGSYVGAIYRWAQERGRELHRPRVVWYGADRMADADRELLERDLAVPVVSTYQADEALRIAFQCELRRGFHLCLDLVAVRVIDAGGRDVAPGGTGEIVISNLTNRATVLLNYRLGDLVTVSAETCACGRSLPTIESIDGRANDWLVLADGALRHPLPVVHALQSVPGVVRIQLAQDREGEVRLLAVAAAEAHWPALHAQLAAVLRDRLGAGLTFRVERVTEIPREPGGKVRVVVSRCGAAG